MVTQVTAIFQVSGTVEPADFMALPILGTVFQVLGYYVELSSANVIWAIK